MIKIKQGLDLPIGGQPAQRIEDAPAVSTVAILGNDYVGMKPTMHVKEGDKVACGQILFSDKKTEGVKFTAPAAGTITEINRGEKRIFQSLVITVDGDESVSFASHDAAALSGLKREAVQEQLIESGLWTTLRTRPYSKVPVPASVPNSIFVTAMDTDPLAANPDVIIAEAEADYKSGLAVLSHLTDGKVFVCKSAASKLASVAGGKVVEETFSGVHPAGLAGTHIHFLDPVGPNKTVWSINYQDVIAVGHLFTAGKLSTTRVIALSGPRISNPRLLRTMVGASTKDLVKGETNEKNNRVISGSVLSGHKARGPFAYLGRTDNQITVLEEGDKRELLRYLSLGTQRHSVKNIYLSKLMPKKILDFTTNTNGSERAMVPIGSYEEVMPLDILPTQLLRALLVGDMDVAVQLGALELSEEDLALCTYACPGKYEYGPILRDSLTRIEQEG